MQHSSNWIQQKMPSSLSKPDINAAGGDFLNIDIDK